MAKLLGLAAIILNEVFFLYSYYRALVIALEVIFLAAAEAIIEVKITIYLDDYSR